MAVVVLLVLWASLVQCIPEASDALRRDSLSERVIQCARHCTGTDAAVELQHEGLREFGAGGAKEAEIFTRLDLLQGVGGRAEVDVKTDAIYLNCTVTASKRGEFWI